MDILEKELELATAWFKNSGNMDNIGRWDQHYLLCAHYLSKKRLLGTLTPASRDMAEALVMRYYELKGSE